MLGLLARGVSFLALQASPYLVSQHTAKAHKERQDKCEEQFEDTSIGKLKEYLTIKEEAPLWNSKWNYTMGPQSGISGKCHVSFNSNATIDGSTPTEPFLSWDIEKKADEIEALRQISVPEFKPK